MCSEHMDRKNLEKFLIRIPAGIGVVLPGKRCRELSIHEKYSIVES